MTIGKMAMHGRADSTQGARRAIKLSSETLRALEAPEPSPMPQSAYSDFCSGHLTCFSCHCTTPSCPM